MVQTAQPGRFGHIVKPDDAWLAKQEREQILEPELPIIDTHHHLWQRGGWTYLLPELLADLDTGHNIVATVFEECRSMYRAGGPEEMRPVGEVEFVAGIAAMSASGGYGPIKVAQGIVGYADLALGDRVEPVLEALIRAGGGRLEGVRYSVGYDADPAIGNSRPRLRAAYVRAARNPRRRRAARGAWAGTRRLVLPPAARGRDRLGAGGAAGDDLHVPCRRRARLRRLCRPQGRESTRRGAPAWRSWRSARMSSVKIGGMLNRGAALDFRGARRAARIPRPGPRRGGLMSSRASSYSAPSAAISRAISRSIRWAPATRRCGTRSSASPPAARRARRPRSTAAPRSGSTS